MKKCPDCDTIMHLVRIDSHDRTPIFLDQCPECGGLWFDNLELFRSGVGTAATVDPPPSDYDPAPAEDIREANEAAFASLSAFQSNPRRCPNDKAPLSRIKDRIIPESLVIERCNTCGGYWLNRGEFIAFQRHRDNYLREKKEREQREEEAAKTSKLDEKTKNEVKRLIVEEQLRRYKEAINRQKEAEEQLVMGTLEEIIYYALLNTKTRSAGKNFALTVIASGIVSFFKILMFPAHASSTDRRHVIEFIPQLFLIIFIGFMIYIIFIGHSYL